MMTVEDLMYELEGLDPKMEVRIASQKSWPFEYSLGSFCVAASDEGEAPDILYLAEGNQIDYLSSAAAEKLGW